VCIGHCGEGEYSCTHVPNSACIPRKSCLNLQIYSVGFFFVGLDEVRILQNKGGYTREIAYKKRQGLPEIRSLNTNMIGGTRTKNHRRIQVHQHTVYLTCLATAQQNEFSRTG
jgi:hypothetical protein